MFIAHDLSVVKQFSDRGVMYYGKLWNWLIGRFYRNPLHPYTGLFVYHSQPNPLTESIETIFMTRNRT